ncbi:Protein NipSnap, partial [Araneus ventricosus]
CREDQELKALSKDLVKNIISRNNQYMLPFSFWGDPEPQDRNSMYEMRSYVLKPGTMIEWGNNWARGINYRKRTAVAGFFSQIGQLYMVHHIWTYKDLLSRKEIREAAWRKPGWDECVAYTVPLIREMRSRWLRPCSFSPIK